MTPDEILAGLAPSLILDLAQLTAEDPRDLAVTVQLMSFGDRVTLMGYGALAGDERGHDLKVQPLFLELSVAALERVCNWARINGFPG